MFITILLIAVIVVRASSLLEPSNNNPSSDSSSTFNRREGDSLIVAVIGDDFVSGYAAKELGASSRGINFLSGADPTAHSLLSTQKKFFRNNFGGARGTRPTPKHPNNSSHFSFFPANDLLDMEVDDWESHQQTDGLTLALEGMGVDSLGRALKIIRKRLKSVQRVHHSNSTWLFLYLGLNDICQRSCSNWSLADYYISKIRSFLATCQSSGQFSKVYLLGLLDLTVLYHNYHLQIKRGKKNSQNKAEDVSYFDKRMSHWCPCFHTDQGRISMLQVTHDINLRLLALQNDTVRFIELSNFDLLQPDILAADHFHLSPHGHQLLASHIIPQINLNHEINLDKSDF